MPAPTRILFVDDEPNLLLTFPTILEQHGFQVTAAATVSEALAQIATRQFDALISDLNIGEPGDGFTVVSAMRRTQPGCVNFILTGYPAFETALQAIRSQVDDYLVKPADVTELVRSLEDKLSNPKAVRRLPAQSLAEFLDEHTGHVIARTLESMKTHPRLGRLPLSDHQRVDHIPTMVTEIVRQLRSGTPNNPTEEVFRAGIEHGESRRQQGYSHDMLVDDTRILDSAFYATVQDHLLRIKLSNLIQDLSRLNDALEAHLQASLIAFHSKKTA
jgi:ActR/RegA family two-component response regulator